MNSPLPIYAIGIVVYKLTCHICMNPDHAFVCVCLCSDVRLAASRLPPVQLALDDIAKLMENLSFRDSVGRSVTDLKQLVQQYLSTTETMAVQDLVSGLLLTPDLGRYVTHLVPYCKSLLNSGPDVVHHTVTAYCTMFTCVYIPVV